MICRCIFSLLACVAGGSALADSGSYAIVCSESTADDPAWRAVVGALEAKYPGAATIAYPDGEPGAALDALRAIHPRHTCFVAKPGEATRAFVVQVHQLTRQYDDDPYCDTFWGILTGFDAANALAIARRQEPLVVERVASGTEVELEKCSEGVWYCELVAGKSARKEAGGDPLISEGGEADSTRALAETLTDYRADLFVTSGHATERDWQIGFRYRNGSFRSEHGRLFGVDTEGRRIDIESPNPKVYLPIGNCLMGHIDGPDAMALAWMKSAGVHQMIGYTVPTWYGYSGWGCLDYFVEQPGRYSFTEAFFANQHALIHRLESCFPEIAGKPLEDPNEAMRLPAGLEGSVRAKELGLNLQDAAGLLFDRDAVAFYGDPGWQARLAGGDCTYDQTLEENGGTWTFTITPKLGADSFQPVNTNGAQRGWRPMVAHFPQRLTDIEVIAGGDLGPLIADDFILVPNPRDCDPSRDYQIVFRASPKVQQAEP